MGHASHQFLSPADRDYQNLTRVSRESSDHPTVQNPKTDSHTMSALFLIEERGRIQDCAVEAPSNPGLSPHLAGPGRLSASPRHENRLDRSCRRDAPSIDSFVRRWLALLGVIGAVTAGCGSTAAAGGTAAAVPPTSSATTAHQGQTDLAALVLSLRDLGTGYNQNLGATHAEQLRDAASGDSPAIVALLRRVWIGGYQAGYTSALPDHPGVWCAAAVFRSTKLGRIARAWKADALSQLGGVSSPAPRGAPGTPLWFFHGHITLSGVRVMMVGYSWQRGHTIGSLTVASRTDTGLTAAAMRMARLEDAHLRAFH